MLESSYYYRTSKIRFYTCNPIKSSTTHACFEKWDYKTIFV